MVLQTCRAGTRRFFGTVAKAVRDSGTEGIQLAGELLPRSRALIQRPLLKKSVLVSEIVAVFVIYPLEKPVNHAGG
jgi:hypothetical protein